MSTEKPHPEPETIQFDELMLKSKTILVGIPAYNESISIGSLVLQAKRYADSVIVVDDGSKDDTAWVAERAGADVIKHDSNMGKGRAIRSILASVQDKDFDVLVLLDGDGQHLTEEITSVIEPIIQNYADVVIGSRYISAHTTETPFYRRIGQQILDMMTNGVAGTKVTDTQSGFRALSPEAVDQLNIRTDGMGVESEMIVTAADQELSIEEVPISVRYEEVDGQTFNPIQHGQMVTIMILKLLRDRRPFVYYGGIGLLLLIVGSSGLLLGRQFQLPIDPSTGSMLLSVLLIIIGVLSIVGGILIGHVRTVVEAEI